MAGFMKLSLTGENYMSVKTRIAVQAEEFYDRPITPYDFTICIVQKGGDFTMSYMLADEVSNANHFAINENDNWIFCYEIPKFALNPDRVHYLPSKKPQLEPENLSEGE